MAEAVKRSPETGNAGSRRSASPAAPFGYSSSFPGGISVSHLRVYDTPAADGLIGGSPHMHFACSEAYLVINGRGSVQTLSGEGFREVSLRAGSLVWFTPGLIHRLINEDGHLEIFAVMENAGLPEHGDSVLTFPFKYLQDEDTYFQVASLGMAGSAFANNREASQRRRDLAVEGFLVLRTELEKGGSLQDFYSHSLRLVRSKESIWRAIWEGGPVSTIWRTKTFLDKLNVGESDYLNQGRVFEIPVDPEHEDRKLGMCGTLRPYLPEGEWM
jgi:mannose-6-phosphate isomerase-like protein (cupin superfamily)